MGSSTRCLLPQATPVGSPWHPLLCLPSAWTSSGQKRRRRRMVLPPLDLLLQLLWHQRRLLWQRRFQCRHLHRQRQILRPRHPHQLQQNMFRWIRMVSRRTSSRTTMNLSRLHRCRKHRRRWFRDRLSPSRHRPCLRLRSLRTAMTAITLRMTLRTIPRMKRTSLMRPLTRLGLSEILPVKQWRHRRWRRRKRMMVRSVASTTMVTNSRMTTTMLMRLLLLQPDRHGRLRMHGLARRILDR
mmetsp:Transcript_2396/g.7049  ORF Transcript_2396/g.7049 Transcript_2396/m.7049 type:complete len:241 (+) Transcript_2396:1163-1885(+)